MARYSFGTRGGKVRARVDSGPEDAAKGAQEVVRQAREAQRKASEDYRERSLALHGPVCARCGREFEGRNRRLLTVHHRDGDHHNNPADGSNWENLCVYCHDDAHSREVLGEYAAGSADEGRPVVYRSDADDAEGAGGLGELLRRALEDKRRGG